MSGGRLQFTQFATGVAAFENFERECTQVEVAMSCTEYIYYMFTHAMVRFPLFWPCDPVVIPFSLRSHRLTSELCSCEEFTHAYV